MSDTIQLPVTPVPGEFDVSGFGGHINTCTNLPVYTIKFETNRERPSHSAAVSSMSTPLKSLYFHVTWVYHWGQAGDNRENSIERSLWRKTYQVPAELWNCQAVPPPGAEVNFDPQSQTATSHSHPIPSRSPPLHLHNLILHPTPSPLLFFLLPRQCNECNEGMLS